MSALWRKTLVYLGLVEEPEEHDDLPEQFDTGPYEPAPRPRVRREPDPEPVRPRVREGARDRGRERDYRSELTERIEEPVSEPVRGAGRERGSNVRPLRVPDPGAAHVRPMDTGAPVRVAVVHVEVFEDVETIGSRYRAGNPVLFDLRAADGDIARRVLDFVSGVTYALRGGLSKAGGRSFLLVPDGVEVPRDERDRLADMGYGL